MSNIPWNHQLVIDKLWQIVNCYPSGVCPNRCIYVHVISLIRMNGQAMFGDQKMKWFFAIVCLKLNHIALSCSSALWIDLSNKLKKKQIRADKFWKGRLHFTVISGAYFTGYSDYISILMQLIYLDFWTINSFKLSRCFVPWQEYTVQKMVCVKSSSVIYCRLPWTSKKEILSCQQTGFLCNTCFIKCSKVRRQDNFIR